MKVYLVRLYLGPLPTLPGISKVPLGLAKYLMLGFLLRMRREEHEEKRRRGWVGDQNENGKARTE